MSRQKYRVQFIYPPISKQERYSSEIGHSGGNQIPLGVYYLAAYLREHGCQVAVIDAEAETLDLEDVMARIDSFAPDLLAVSATTVAFHRANELVSGVKKTWPELPVALGGPHMTSNTQHALTAAVDFGVVGEGEEVLLELVTALQTDSDWRAIAGLAWQPSAGEPVINPRQVYIENLDRLPFPAYDLIPDLSVYHPPPSNYRALPVANIISSRGCPSLCTFCDNSIFGTHFRQRSAQNVADEIEHLYRHYGVREIAFVDDTFTINKQRIYDLFAELTRRDIQLPWTCMSRINTVDEELLTFMRDHGCWHISFGIESADLEILQRIKKQISLDRVQQVIATCAQLGIRSKGFFIVGHPGENLQTINKTIDFALDLALDDVVVTINTPIPGSTQYREAAQYGQLDETDWSQFNCWRPVFVPTGLTKELLLAKQKEFYRRFYLRPRILWRYLQSFFAPGGGRRFVSLLRSLPFIFKS